MKREFEILICVLVAGAQLAFAAPGVRIVQLSGEVKIRRGVEESWEPASTGMWLEDIDTILTLEGASVVLEFGDNQTFRLAGNAMLDIADLRKVTERELFLYIMSAKVSKIKPRPEKTPLRIGNVSVVRGAKFTLPGSDSVHAERDWWRLEANGAVAMYAQNFFPNAALKLHKILEKFPFVEDCGEVRFYLARSLEALNKPGQARDQYQLAIQQAESQQCTDSKTKRRLEQARKTIERLKP